VAPPANPLDPNRPLPPFRAALPVPAAHALVPGLINELDIAPTLVALHPDLPPVPSWGYGVDRRVSSPGPLLEVTAGTPVRVRWRNRLPASVHPHDPGAAPAELPFETAVLPADPSDTTDLAQNRLGREGAPPEVTDNAPIGWTSVHLHGGHSSSDADGFPDNMTPTGGEQLVSYDNSYDNAEIGLGKVGEFLWYHDHAMNGTRYHVYAGLSGGYLIRDPREAALGLPTGAHDGEIVAVVADRNLDATDGRLRLLHKVTTDTAEFFGPLTLVNGSLWPRLALRPQVYRLRLLNGSNARAYRLHLVGVRLDGDGSPVVTVHHDRVQIIGSDGGLLWRSAALADDAALTLAPSERIDVLVNLAGLADGDQLFLINSAQAPFGGDPAPALAQLWAAGDPGNRNPFPWVLRIDIDHNSPHPGRPEWLFGQIAGAELNPAFRRLVVDPPAGPPDPLQPPPFPVTDAQRRLILLAETDPAGHLFLQEIVADPAGAIQLQLPGEQAPATYRVQGWLAGDPARSDTRVSFYDRTALRPQLEQWQLWTFVNTTGDTHPIHVHQIMFQPIGDAGGRLVFDTTAADHTTHNRYDPLTRSTTCPLTPDQDNAPRAYEATELRGWNDVIRVDPGNVVTVAARFDIPGRYVYHCHILEHEDTEMMRPFVVTVRDMEDGPGMPM
jgi:spore coat protein A